MSDYFLGSFVTVAPQANMPNERDASRAQVVAVQGDRLTLRYADGTHRLIAAYIVIMDPDQSTPVWPPAAQE